MHSGALPANRTCGVAWVRAGRKTALERFSPEAMVAANEAIYAELQAVAR